MHRYRSYLQNYLYQTYWSVLSCHSKTHYWILSTIYHLTIIYLNSTLAATIVLLSNSFVVTDEKKQQYYSFNFGFIKFIN